MGPCSSDHMHLLLMCWIIFKPGVNWIIFKPGVGYNQVKLYTEHTDGNSQWSVGLMYEVLACMHAWINLYTTVMHADEPGVHIYNTILSNCFSITL